MCPRSAEYTIYLKGENHVNPEDTALRDTIEFLTQESLIHYCTEGTLPDDYLTSAYDPFLKSPNAGNINTLHELEDPLTFFLALLFTYRGFALLDPKYQEEVHAANGEEKEQLQAVLDYYDFRKNLITLITTNSIGHNLWFNLSYNQDILKSPEHKKLFLQITKYVLGVALLQDSDIEPICSDPIPLKALEKSLNWAVLYTYLIQELLEEKETELISKGVNLRLLQRFLFYPRLEEDAPANRTTQAEVYQLLRNATNEHLRIELRNKSFIENLAHAFSLAKDSRLPFIAVLGNNHVSEIYQTLKSEGYPVEVIFDNNRFLEEILGNSSTLSTDS